jgi:amidase/6-aminohexanoate-cyclic-dimer hydrolase
MAGFSDYENYDGVGLAALIRSGEATAEEVLQACLDRIEARNPALNAVVLRMDDQARAAVAGGLPDGPLTGVPYLIKDLHAVCEGVETSNGSRLFEGVVADHDSTLIERIRRAGLVIAGKTNTPEFGLNASTEPARFGPTLNPYDLTRSAGGSSGGSAAAVAARILPVTHATDGGGSIRIPAANCGLFGLKPSRGRNPQGPDGGEGWNGLSTAHAVSITVRDSAAVLDATHGPAPGDPYAAPPPLRPYAEEVGADPERLRIALLTAGFDGAPVDAACRKAAEDTARLCESLGHHVEEAKPAIDVERMVWAMRTIIACNLRNMFDMVGMGRGRPVSPGEVEPVSWLFGEEGAATLAPHFARAIHAIHMAGREMGRFFEEYDLLLSPTVGRFDLQLGEIDTGGCDLDAYMADLVGYLPFTPLFNMTGCPAASVPVQWTESGQPVGVQFGAKFGDEAVLFRIAAQLEAAQPWRDRRPPLLDE